MILLKLMIPGHRNNRRKGCGRYLEALSFAPLALCLRSPGTHLDQEAKMCRHGSRFFVTLMLISVLGACQQPNNDDESSSGLASSTELASFAPTDMQRTEILATVQGIFDALAGDVDKLSEVMMPDVTMRSTSIQEDGTVISSTSTVDGLRDRIVSGGSAMVERMFDSRIMVSGPIATVWTPYDFYSGGEFSHCGIDVATLLHTQGGWRIMSLDWSRQQPPDCELHPDGPPRGI